jgi:hypothetical protein
LQHSDASLALTLHPAVIPRMYEVLTANTPGCVAFSLPVQRRNLVHLGIPASFRSLPNQRSARLTWSGGFEPERRPVPGYHSVPGTIQTRHNRLPGRKASICDGRRAPQAPRRAFSDRQRRRFLPPTCSDGPTLDAPDCVADQDPRNNRYAAERKLRAPPCSVRIMFGGAPRVAFWPSPHPRIRWTVASPGRATRARRDTRPPPS